MNVIHRGSTGLRVFCACALVACAPWLPLACGSEPRPAVAPTPTPPTTIAATTTAPHEGSSASATASPPATASASSAPELPKPVVILEGLKGPERMVGDATTLYVTEGKTDAIFTAPKSGGEPKSFVGNQKGLAEIALDATSVYWTTGDGKGGGTVMKLGLKGGTPIKLATVPPSDLGGLIGIEVDDKNVYWVDSTSQGKVMKVGKMGGAPIVVADKQRSPYDIAGDASGIYWTLFGTGDAGGMVMAMSAAKPGAKVEPTVLASGQKTPWCIAVDGKNVYWINKGPPGSVMKAAIGGGAPVMLAGDLKPTFMAVDAGTGGNVYWTSEDDDTVSMVSKEGGAVTILAKGQRSPSGILVDATTIYFTNKADGTVMKLAK